LFKRISANIYANWHRSCVDGQKRHRHKYLITCAHTFQPTCTDLAILTTSFNSSLLLLVQRCRTLSTVIDRRRIPANLEIIPDTVLK